MKKDIYESPFLKIFKISKNLGVLHSLSAEGTIDDFNSEEYVDFQ